AERRRLVAAGAARVDGQRVGVVDERDLGGVRAVRGAAVGAGRLRWVSTDPAAVPAGHGADIDLAQRRKSAKNLLSAFASLREIYRPTGIQTVISDRPRLAHAKYGMSRNSIGFEAAGVASRYSSRPHGAADCATARPSSTVTRPSSLASNRGFSASPTGNAT